MRWDEGENRSMAEPLHKKSLFHAACGPFLFPHPQINPNQDLHFLGLCVLAKTPSVTVHGCHEHHGDAFLGCVGYPLRDGHCAWSSSHRGLQAPRSNDCDKFRHIHGAV